MFFKEIWPRLDLAKSPWPHGSCSSGPLDPGPHKDGQLHRLEFFLEGYERQATNIVRHSICGYSKALSIVTKSIWGIGKVAHTVNDSSWNF